MLPIHARVIASRVADWSEQTDALKV